jgi:hypothetical protein
VIIDGKFYRAKDGAAFQSESESTKLLIADAEINDAMLRLMGLMNP